MSHESRAAFFRQSGWLVIATTLSGACLAAVYPVISGMASRAELGIFMSMLRVFTVLAIPAAGLQIVLAQEAAAAISPEGKAALARTIRSVAAAVFGVWLLITAACGLNSAALIAQLKISRPATLWITLGLVLAGLFLPIAQGLLQGTQNFLWLGWSIILNGAGRLAGIAAAVHLFKAQSAGALAGALAGIAAAVAVAFWPSRHLVEAPEGRFDWKGWLKRVLPLTGGVGSVLFLMNADVIFVQTYFPEDVTVYYSAVAMMGVGLVAFTTPMAAVMFPKLVRGLAQSRETGSFLLAISGTSILGALGALICTIAPGLPLRILFFNRPDLLKSAPLVPWFMWAILPVTIANVLVNNLLARRQFKAVPWLVAVAVGYGLCLVRYHDSWTGSDPLIAFKGLVQRLGVFSLLLLGVAGFFTFFSKKGPRHA